MLQEKKDKPPVLTYGIEPQGLHPSAFHSLMASFWGGLLAIVLAALTMLVGIRRFVAAIVFLLVVTLAAVHAIVVCRQVFKTDGSAADRWVAATAVFVAIAWPTGIVFIFLRIAAWAWRCSLVQALAWFVHF